jgi:hypothetical protein
MDIRRPISETRSRSRVTAEQGAGAGRGEWQGGAAPRGRVFGMVFVLRRSDAQE